MAQRKPHAMPEDELFADWVKWIENELIGIAWNRRIYREVTRVFRHNTHLQEVGGFLHEWMHLNYTAGVTIAFRREVDRANHMGFVHLLGEIADYPQVLSRQRHTEGWQLRSPFESELRRKAFEAIPFVSPSDDPMRDHIDPAFVREDIVTIRRETELAHNYVEQTSPTEWRPSAAVVHQ